MAPAAYAQDFQWPVSGPSTQCFGDSFSGRGAGYYYDQYNTRKYFAGYDVLGYRMHRAIDIGAANGAPIKPARPGTAYKRYDSSYGNHVVMDHGNGYFTLYAHMSQFGNFSDGQWVGLDFTIGYVGATGFVTGPHLHFEIRHSSSSAYAAESHYVPCSGISQGAKISFDYPGIGPLGGQVPGYPTGLWPADQTTVSGASVNLSWNPIAGCDNHHIYVEYWNGSTYLYYYSWYSGSSASSFTFWPQFKNTWYRWWVRAHNSAGWGEWSGSAEFYYETASGPVIPTNLRPQWPNDGWGRSGPSVKLTWTPVAGATNHHVRVEFWNGSSYQYYYDWYTYNSAGSFTFWPVVKNSWFRWRVRSETASGWSAWSTEGTSSGHAEFWYSQ
jgi:hypothetical protein